MSKPAYRLLALLLHALLAVASSVRSEDHSSDTIFGNFFSNKNIQFIADHHQTSKKVESRVLIGFRFVVNVVAKGQGEQELQSTNAMLDIENISSLLQSDEIRMEEQSEISQRYETAFQQLLTRNK